MGDNTKSNRESNDRLASPSPKDLLGRQSVRATFKLSTRAIEALSTVSFHLGIKQKSLFDHLIDDIGALEIIAQQINFEPSESQGRVQKTYVLSRRTLTCLDRAAKEFEASRDALVEFSIQRLLPVIAKEKERHKKRKRLLDRVDGFIASGESLLQEAGEALGEEDPLFIELRRAMTVLQHAAADMTDFIEKGKAIEKF